MFICCQGRRAQSKRSALRRMCRPIRRNARLRRFDCALRFHHPHRREAAAGGAEVGGLAAVEARGDELHLTLAPGEIAKFFQWVSGSIKMSSKSLDAKPGENIELPPPPTGFTIVP